MQCRHALIIKGYPAADENVKDDAKTPDIHLRAGIGTSLEELGSREVETAAKCFEVPSRGEEIAESKVDDLDVAGLADEDVFDLQITMDYAVSMAIVESTGDLTAKLPRLLLLQLAMGYDVVQHLATIDELEEHVPMIVGPHHIP